MKKILSSLIGLLTIVLFLSGCGIYKLDWFVVPDDSDFNELVQEINTPEKISLYMLEHFKYVLNFLIAKSPYELYIKKEGDCNDFALFGQYIANENGYKTYKVRIYWCGTTTHHVITVYVEDSFLSFTDNLLYYSEYQEIRSIVDQSAINTRMVWKKYIVFDYDNNIIEKGEK